MMGTGSILHLNLVGLMAAVEEVLEPGLRGRPFVLATRGAVAPSYSTSRSRLTGRASGGGWVSTRPGASFPASGNSRPGPNSIPGPTGNCSASPPISAPSSSGPDRAIFSSTSTERGASGASPKTGRPGSGNGSRTSRASFPPSPRRRPPPRSPPERRRITGSLTLEPDSADPHLIARRAAALAAELGFAMRREGLGTGRIELRFSFADCRTSTASSRLSRPLARDDELALALRPLLDRARDRHTRIRSLGIELGYFSAAGPELDLFTPEAARHGRLQDALDRVHLRYGLSAIVPATSAMLTRATVTRKAVSPTAVPATVRAGAQGSGFS